jgi:hypothetical protein
MSLSDYLLRELTWMASRPTWDEVFEEIDREGPILKGEGVDTVELIRQIREERDRELMSRIRPDDPSRDRRRRLRRGGPADQGGRGNRPHPGAPDQ